MFVRGAADPINRPFNSSVAAAGKVKESDPRSALQKQGQRKALYVYFNHFSSHTCIPRMEHRSYYIYSMGRITQQ